MGQPKMGDVGGWIGAVTGVVSAGITAWLGYRASQQKARTDLTMQERQLLAQDAESLRKAWREDYTRARERLAEVEARLATCEERMRELERENDRLRDRLRGARLEEDQP